jgi:DNA-binding NtrC family response regulator
MSAKKEKILIVDDDPHACIFLAEALNIEGFETTWTEDPTRALALASESKVDAVITDLNMPKLSGLELCKRFASAESRIPVLVVTAFGSVSAAVDAMRSGAHDFIVKPFEIEAVVIALRRTIEHYSLRTEVEQLREVVHLGTQFGSLIGNSSAMREVYDVITRISGHEAPVLLTGESGTGKDLVARELHRRSKRAAEPFVAINAAALPETLLESELFGHVKGAFTDARSAREGLFVQAAGGTLFLDEVAELPLNLQAKLLRALQERKVRPIGAAAEVPFHARIVTATNQDLDEVVERRAFRQDLYYRINVVHIDLPPLRCRGGDVILLAQAFLTQLASAISSPVTGMSREVEQRLLSYTWPGNVRELRNCMERALTLCRGEILTLEDLPPKIRRAPPEAAKTSHSSRSVVSPEDLSPLATVERQHILLALEACAGNKSLTASVLGLSRKTLYRKLQEYSLE